MSVEELKKELAHLSATERTEIAAYLSKIRTHSSSTSPCSFLDTARHLKLDGPPDWSERFDEYLYGNGGDATR